MDTTNYLGDPGERFAAASLGQSMLSELHPGTSTDDDGKVDLRLTYRCPYSPQRRELRCQVKAGDSYGNWTKTKDRYRIDVNEKFRNQLSSNDDPTLIVWIPSNGSPTLYGLIPPRRGRSPLYISPSSVVDPSMIFDVARRQAIWNGRGSFRQVTLKRSTSSSEAFKKISLFRKARPHLRSSVVRNVQLPNRALRHVTRLSRQAYRRNLSCDSLPYLPRLLESEPRRFQYLERNHLVGQSRSRVSTLLLLEYPDCFRFENGDEYSCFVRIRELVSFPSKWRDSPLCLSGPTCNTIESRASIESWYLKRKKKC
jgi:hypothetical protein